MLVYVLNHHAGLFFLYKAEKEKLSQACTDRRNAVQENQTDKKKGGHSCIL